MKKIIITAEQILAEVEKISMPYFQPKLPSIRLGLKGSMSTYACPYCFNQWDAVYMPTSCPRCEGELSYAITASAVPEKRFYSQSYTVIAEATISGEFGLVVAGVEACSAVIFDQTEASEPETKYSVKSVAFCTPAKKYHFVRSETEDGDEASFIKTKASMRKTMRGTVTNINVSDEGKAFMGLSFLNVSAIERIYEEAEKPAKEKKDEFPKIPLPEPTMLRNNFVFCKRMGADYIKDTEQYHIKCYACGYEGDVSTSYHKFDHKEACPKCGNDKQPCYCQTSYEIGISGDYFYLLSHSHYFSEYEDMTETIEPQKACFLNLKTDEPPVVFQYSYDKPVKKRTWFLKELDEVPYWGGHPAVTYHDMEKIYSGIELLVEANASMLQLLQYMYEWRDNKVLETFIKRGLTEEYLEETGYESTAYPKRHFLNKKGKDVSEITHLPERLIKFYIKNNELMSMANIKELLTIDNNLRETDIIFIAQNHINCDILKTINNSFSIELHKMCEYLENVRVNQCFQPKQAVVEWRDYLLNAQKIGTDLTDKHALFPGSLKREHDRVLFKTQLIASKEKEESFVEKTAEYADLAYASGKLFVKVPSSMQELFEEGRKLSHCVGTYADRIISGETFILFIRREEYSDVPFFTVEVNAKHEIVQIRGFCNSTKYPPELVKFVSAWAKAKKLIY